MKEGERDLKERRKTAEHSSVMPTLDCRVECTVCSWGRVDFSQTSDLLTLFANYDDLNKWANESWMSFRNTESMGQKSVKIRLFEIYIQAMQWDGDQSSFYDILHFYWDVLNWSKVTAKTFTLSHTFDISTYQNSWKKKKFPHKKFIFHNITVYWPWRS